MLPIVERQPLPREPQAMRFDTPGLSFDDGHRFDAGQNAPPTLPTTMKKPKLELQNKTDAELNAFAGSVLTGLTGNPHFPSPDPELSELSDAITEFHDAHQDFIVKQSGAKTATALKKQKRKALEGVLNDLAGFVDRKAKGEEAKILSANMPVRDDRTPIGELPPPANLSATYGDHPGEVDLLWDPVKGTRTYDVEYRLHDGPSEWARFASVSPSRATVTGLEPGAEYAFRVRAVGAAGPGPWSDEAVKRAA